VTERRNGGMADRTTELQKQNYYTELQNYRTT
jgi:hypothetical protein